MSTLGRLVRPACFGLLILASAAQAVAISGATEIRITSAASSYIQVSELEAVDFGLNNVAIAANGGSATAFSSYSAFSTPDKAIDGLIGHSESTIYHSGDITANEFLDVTFAAASLSSLTLYGRTDCCSNRDVYNIEIFDAGHNSLYTGTLDATNPDHFATLMFDSTVPEPTTWVLLIGGFAMVGTVVRRRRTAIVA